MILFLNGKFLHHKKAKVSVFDHGFMYGDGVFERTRTYNGKIWNLKNHVKRLFHSARLVGINIPWAPQQIEKWVRQTAAKNKFKESGIRIELTRGEASRDLRYDFISKRRPALVIAAAPLTHYPEDFYKKGIAVTTFQKERTFPEVKSTSLLAHILAQQDMFQKNAKEAVFIDCRGYVTEGTSSNIFFVKNGILLVPKARVLPGTTAEIVVQLVKKAKLKIKKKLISRKELKNMDECFITSVTRGIMPVSKIDGKKVCNGKIGRITEKLMIDFKNYVQSATQKA